MNNSRSVSAGGDINASAIATGDHATATTHSANVDNSPANPVIELAAIRALLASLTDVDPKALTRLDEAAAEARKGKPDHVEINTLIRQATQYARSANGFAEQFDRLTPHLRHLAHWLGQSWTDFSSMLGL